MHEIPETLAAAQALQTKSQATANPLTLTQVITGGLQNWVQELLAEAFEGGYLTASLTASGLTVTDLNDQPIYHNSALTSTALVPQFEADAHATLLAVQTTIRQAITAHAIQG